MRIEIRQKLVLLVSQNDETPNKTDETTEAEEAGGNRQNGAEGRKTAF